MSAGYDYLASLESARRWASHALLEAIARTARRGLWPRQQQKFAVEALEMLGRYRAEIVRSTDPVPTDERTDFDGFARACLVAWLAVDAYRRARDGAS